MEYSEEAIHAIMENWKGKGYNELITVDKKMFYLPESRKHFPLPDAVEEDRVFFSADEACTNWSMHALRFAKANNKGIFLCVSDFYRDEKVLLTVIQQLRQGHFRTNHC